MELMVDFIHDLTILETGLDIFYLVRFHCEWVEMIVVPLVLVFKSVQWFSSPANLMLLIVIFGLVLVILYDIYTFMGP